MSLPYRVENGMMVCEEGCACLCCQLEGKMPARLKSGGFRTANDDVERGWLADPGILRILNLPNMHGPKR